MLFLLKIVVLGIIFLEHDVHILIGFKEEHVHGNEKRRLNVD